MRSAIYKAFDPLRRPLSRRQAIFLVFLCTLIGAAAQIFMKMGANLLPAISPLQLIASPWLVLGNWQLLMGLSLYGVFTVLLVIALRDGELSILYPVIALNYVWVTLLSMALFRETMNPFKGAGISVIVAGVVLLGKGSR
ncbi:MAG: EamA family transporter [Bryobacterales bacterium]|nr:EamA family transporter [Bryobacterales bacterium]